MNLRNIVESFGYALAKFVSNTILFSILYLIFGVENWFNSVLIFCLPLSIGMFLGYLGGKSFVFFSKFKNFLFGMIIIIILNMVEGFLIQKILLQNEEWLKIILNIEYPMVIGYILSVFDGLKSNFSDNGN